MKRLHSFRAVRGLIVEVNQNNQTSGHHTTTALSQPGTGVYFPFKIFFRNYSKKIRILQKVDYFE